uniref:Uncharacterized protein n=1 Tax=Knipowitschia caucasica TaxID=637954 RepID=A0AAV2KN61_KNICA
MYKMFVPVCAQAGSRARATVAPLPPSSSPSSLSSSLGPPPVKVSRPALTFLSSSSWGDDRQAPTPCVRAPRHKRIGNILLEPRLGEDEQA